MKNYDAFLSYASENEKLANEIVGGLKSKGFNIWYAPLNLSVGDKLLDSLEEGMKISSNSILLISKEYLSKPWTNFEMDIIMRNHIERGKKVLPLWLGVTKSEVEERHSSLCGLFSVSISDDNFREVISKLIKVLSIGSPNNLIIPSYESGKHRFLSGRGEVCIGSLDGPATTLWEYLLYAKDDGYPVYFEGEVFHKTDLLYHACSMIPHISEEIEHWINKEGLVKIIKMCCEAGYDPDMY